jgi:bifunctional DNA-binding transcriptional regulator/antitoxin component of YhaV-PrlF toxin-antitoxin module
MFNWGDKIKSYKEKIEGEGRITIPEEYRAKYHLNEGVEVSLILTDEGILVKRKIVQLRGYLKGKIDPKGFEKDIKTIRKQYNLHANSYK